MNTVAGWRFEVVLISSYFGDINRWGTSLLPMRRVC